MTPTTYPAYDQRSAFDAAARSSIRKVDNLHTKDVLSAFIALPERGKYLSVDCGSVIPGTRYSDSLINHCQGIQRLPVSKYLFISGGEPGYEYGQYKYGSAAHVFLAEIGSHDVYGPWGGGAESKLDNVFKAFILDNEKWHAGGISLLGQILAVPIYGESKTTGRANSEIVFFDVTYPLQPTVFDHRIDRPNVMSGATALARLPNGRFVCAVWSDSDMKKPRFDFYLSQTSDFYDGFQGYNGAEEGYEKTVLRSDVKDITGATGDAKYQSLNFVTQAYTDAGDYHLYLIGMDRAAGDIAELLLVEFPAATLGPQPTLEKPMITLIERQKFKCGDGYGQFKGANGVFVDTDGGLYIYSAGYWRRKNRIRIVEFS